MPLLPKPRVLLTRLAIFVAASAVTSLLFINFCHLVFQCGCMSWWAGAADHCNIHTAGVPHCPWCTSNAGYVSFAAIVVVQALVAFWPGGLGALQRLLGALAAFPIVGGLGALIAGLASGYWA